MVRRKGAALDRGCGTCPVGFDLDQGPPNTENPTRRKLRYWPKVSPARVSPSSISMPYEQGLVCRVVVWMAAIMLPIQSAIVPACACASSVGGMQEVKNVRALEQTTRGGCCLCRKAPPASTRDTRRSACCGRKANPKQDGCQCGSGCSCKSRQPADKPVQHLPQPRVRSLESWAIPLVVASYEENGSCQPRIGSSASSSHSVWDFCVLFCRFLI